MILLQTAMVAPGGGVPAMRCAEFGAAVVFHTSGLVTYHSHHTPPATADSLEWLAGEIRSGRLHANGAYVPMVV